MIKIKVKRSADLGLRHVTITGHAHYAQAGEDIVCAAVSGISLGMVNVIERMFGVRVYRESDHEGVLHCQLPDGLEPAKQEKIQLLLEAMVLSLEGVAEEYPTYVQIEKR
jgi:uncharacterized protein YsxB (DUF464 family)